MRDMTQVTLVTLVTNCLLYEDKNKQLYTISKKYHRSLLS